MIQPITCRSGWRGSQGLASMGAITIPRPEAGEGENEKLTFVPASASHWLKPNQRQRGRAGQGREEMGVRRWKTSSKTYWSCLRYARCSEGGPRSGLPVLTSPSRKSKASHTIPPPRVESLFSPRHTVRIWGKRAAGEIQSKTASKLFKAHLCNKRLREEKGAGQQVAG